MGLIHNINVRRSYVQDEVQLNLLREKIKADKARDDGFVMKLAPVQISPDLEKVRFSIAFPVCSLGLHWIPILIQAPD